MWRAARSSRQSFQAWGKSDLSSIDPADHDAFLVFTSLVVLAFIGVFFWDKTPVCIIAEDHAVWYTA